MTPSTRTPRSPAAGWPDAAIAGLVARQRTMITHAQLRELGVSSSAIDRAVRRGRLHRVFRGVYSVVPQNVRPPLAAEQAAVLAAGPLAILALGSAALVQAVELPLRTRDVHVLVPHAHRHSRAGLVVHRTAVLHPDDHHRCRGLPVTSVARTVLDLAPLLSDGELERLVDRALRQTSRTKLGELVARHPGRPGAARLHQMLDPRRPSADTWSAAERRLRDLIDRAGLPLPEANVAIEGGRFVPDLLWRSARVIVEYDSDAFHSGPAAGRRDAARHNALTALGYTVIHVTRDELRRRPERILVQIAAALARAQHAD
jgi:very-short-patch-repair endonuclease